MKGGRRDADYRFITNRRCRKENKELGSSQNTGPGSRRLAALGSAINQDTVLIVQPGRDRARRGDGSESPRVQLKSETQPSGHLLPPISCVPKGWLPTSAAGPQPGIKTSRLPHSSPER